jgi:hypothetical protein
VFAPEAVALIFVVVGVTVIVGYVLVNVAEDPITFAVFGVPNPVSTVIVSPTSTSVTISAPEPLVVTLPVATVVALAAAVGIVMLLGAPAE